MAPAVGELVAGIREHGWRGLLDLVVLSVLWFLCMLSAGLEVAVPVLLSHGAGLLITALAALAPLALVGPGSIGLFRGADGVWSGECSGPLDSVRYFWAGLSRRYLRGVGLSVVWAVVVLGTYANLREDVSLVPHFLLLGLGILLLYLLLFFVMVHVYLLPVLATTDFSLWEAARVGAWEAVANPMFTLVVLLGPAAVLAVGFVVHPLLPMLLGGALGLLCTGALRFAPYRHPDLPAPRWLDRPEEQPPRPPTGTRP